MCFVVNFKDLHCTEISQNLVHSKNTIWYIWSTQNIQEFLITIQTKVKTFLLSFADSIVAAVSIELLQGWFYIYSK